MRDQAKEKEKKIVATCPVCKRNIYEGDKVPLTQYQIATAPGHPAMYSMPKITCLRCGVEFFPPDVVKKIRENMEGGPSRIILPNSVKLS